MSIQPLAINIIQRMDFMVFSSRLGLAILVLCAIPNPVWAEAALYSSTLYPTTHARGLNPSEKMHSFIEKAPSISFSGSGYTVPSAYSLRGSAGPVEDQGQCGSCWDFSLTSTLRGTLILSNSDPGRLSFNYLLNCDSRQQACKGGDFSAASFLVSPMGAPSYDSDGPYVGAAGPCQSETVIASAKAYKMLGTNGNNPSFQDIAYVIGVLHKPVTIDVAADTDFENYQSGVYNGCSSQNPRSINHMVVIEGYDCESAKDSSGNCSFNKDGNLNPEVGSWIVRNSWGYQWGDEGYITIKATNRLGLRCNSVATHALFFDL